MHWVVNHPSGLTWEERQALAEDGEEDLLVPPPEAALEPDDAELLDLYGTLCNGFTRTFPEAQAIAWRNYMPAGDAAEEQRLLRLFSLIFAETEKAKEKAAERKKAYGKKSPEPEG